MENLSRHIKNQKGVSLVEVMVGSTILFIVLYFSTFAFLQTTTQNVLMTVREDAASLSDELNGIVKGSACGIVKLTAATAAIDIGDNFFSSPTNTISLNGASGVDGLLNNQMLLFKDFNLRPINFHLT
jgi:hypothetical protein